MKRLTFLFFLILFLFSISGFAQSKCGIQINNYGYSLNDAAFLDDSTIIVVGDYGVIMKSNDGGTNWRRINSGTYSSLLKTQFLNSKTGYVIGSYLSLRTDDGGENWFKIPLNAPGLYSANLYFLSPDTGFVAGVGGKIYKTVDGGRKWQDQQNVFDDLSAVTFLNDSVGFVCGTSKTLLKTTNLGKTWQTIDMSSFGFNLRFVDVVFTNANHGYLLGNGGEIIVTSDTGATWKKIATVPTDYATNIYFTDEHVGYVIGGWLTSTLYKTTDGGANWHAVNYSDGGSFSGIALNKNGQKGIVVGDAAGYGSTAESGHVLLKSEDAGENWSTISYLNGQTNLYDVSFVDDSTGYIVGGWSQGSGFGYKTTNTGLTWEKYAFYSAENVTECQFIKKDVGFIRSDNIYFTEDGISFKKVPGPDSTIMGSWGNKMFFFNADTGVCAFSGGLYRTTDRGKSWKKVYDGDFGADIEFRDSLGFAVGYSTVARSTDAGKTWVAIDTFSTPLFMRTVFLLNADTIFIGGAGGLLYASYDSGLTWTKVSSDIPIPINILDLHFYDDSVGIAITNNNGGIGEIYHSYDYGLTWTRTRQVSENIYKYSDVSNGKGFFVGDRGTLMKIDRMNAPTLPSYIIGDTLVTKDSAYTYNLLGHDGETIKWGAIHANIVGTSGDSVKIIWPDTGYYSITVNLSNDCGGSPTREFKVHVVDSIINSIHHIYTKDEIKIFPNPTNGQFTIEVNSFRNTNTSLNIFDLNGRLLVSDIINKKSTIDVSDLANGVYMLSIEDNVGITVKKLVVVR